MGKEENINKIENKKNAENKISTKDVKDKKDMKVETQKKEATAIKNDKKQKDLDEKKIDNLAVKNQNVETEAEHNTPSELENKVNASKKRVKAIKITSVVLVVLMNLVLVFAFVSTRLYTAKIISGSSMYPTLNGVQVEDEIEYQNKYEAAYYTNYKSPNVNDIIIIDYFKAIGEKDQYGNNLLAIKRLIANSGDTICYYGGTLLKNGVPINEYYFNLDNSKTYNGKTAEEWKAEAFEESKANFEKFCRNIYYRTFNLITKTTTFVQNCQNSLTYAQDHVRYDSSLETYVLTVPEDYMFFLGDNRKLSNDCSRFGPVEKSCLVAKVDFILPVSAGSLTQILNEMKYVFSK